ncbi:MAG TPA: DUF6787 family protein [Chryseolinea sp.]|nr:DUF6787 family protein [Chryseolinea sp.]
MAEQSWIIKLKERWKLRSAMQVIVVLIVFACTGFTVLFIKRPILHFLAGDRGDSVTASIIYYVFILPIYNIVLLGYGFLFGQFNFFWEFEKRFFNRIFKKKK